MSFRSARKKAGLSVREVMKALNVTDAAVYLWETRRTNPMVSKLEKLAKLYGCTVDELLREDE